MSSRRSRNGGTVMTNAPTRKYRSSRNVPLATASFKSRFVAATTRALHLDRPFSADSADFVLLQRAQQFCLHGRCNLADFVQEQRAIAGDLEQTRLIARRAGERPRT